jgi:ParB family chromosome partitioning protein
MAQPAAVEKKDEKVEKRKALGRGLASLLPGPRVVPSAETLGASSETATSVGAGQQNYSIGEKQVPHFPRNDNAEGVDQIAAAADVVTIPAGAVSPDARPQPESPLHRVTNLALELIDKNPYQTRHIFDEILLSELADSIGQNGVVQPVVVRPSEDARRYVLVLGERRLRASKMAGQRTIPAIVRRLSNQQAAEMTILENVQREDLNPVEQAEAFRVLSKQFNLTQAQIAERVGVSRETVANYMRLLRLPEDVMKYMLEGRLTFSDARELLALDNDEHVRIVANEVVTKRLKWDEIEERVRELNGFAGLPKPESQGHGNQGGARWMDPNVRAAQTVMEQTLGMRVRIKDRNGRGKIVIEYASVDEYERVVEMLRVKK